MKKIFLMILIVVIVIGAIVFLKRDKDNDYVMENKVETQNNESMVNKNTSSSTDDTIDSKNFTMEEVSMHKEDGDCYTVINDIVYDLTAFVNKHPGGDKNILKICGIDGTSAFEGQHGGNEKIENTLAGFEIGVLIK